MNLEDFEKDLNEWIESSDGKIYFNKERNKNKLKLQRFQSFKEWLKINNFDNLLYRIIIKHDEEYKIKCCENGYEPYPNNVLQFIIEYVFINGKEVNKKNIKRFKLNCIIPNIIVEFKGFYFQIINGQGIIIRIYNKDDARLLLTI